MGSSASKPAETKVFTPNTQIDISPKLAHQLENSIETDYVRSQYTEKYLQEELNKKLDQISIESNKTFTKTLSAAIATNDENPELTSQKLNAKIDELASKLNEKKDKILQLNDNILNQKKEIVNCLIANKDKPLNCWDEVQNFEKLVKQLK